MMTTTLSQQGWLVRESYLTPQECQEFLEQIARYRRVHDLAEISRPMKDRPLRYKVIDGETIKDHFPDLWKLYDGGLLDLVRSEAGEEIELLDNQKVGVNINIMDTQGSTYRWHYDRNAVTAILYLNKVDGGETELFPNYRILLNRPGLAWLQRLLDGVMHLALIRTLFVQRLVIPPATGKLILMLGNKSWHSVRPVFGDEERINVIFSYDLPNTDRVQNAELDSYLYSQQDSATSDPNYKK